MEKIYCVEDDESIRELVLYALRSGGYETAGFEDAAGLMTALREQPLPALILLDIMLPGEDGLIILKRLRQNADTAGVPVIMVTAKASEYDRVKGLDQGADDYITKPFGVMELMSRVRAVLRRVNNNFSPETLLLNDITVDISRHVVTVGGEEVTLTFKEFELLTYLIKNIGLVLSREKLMEAVWGFDFEGESRTVDMHIKSLRQKLGDAGESIQTVRGVGYKIVAGGR
ncbi:MAG: response regulator transcription factor [Angelakisella sp.]